MEPDGEPQCRNGSPSTLPSPTVVAGEEEKRENDAAAMIDSTESTVVIGEEKRDDDGAAMIDSVESTVVIGEEKPEDAMIDSTESTVVVAREDDGSVELEGLILSDEYLPREYMKRRRSSIGFTPAAAAVAAAPKKKAPAWCVLCERPIGEAYDGHLDEPGAVICLNPRCQRGFHIACLRGTGVSVADPDSYRCSACTLKQVVCPECYKSIDDSDSVLCPARSCTRRYHKTCWTWGDRLCPAHACRKCVERKVDCGSEGFIASHDRYSCLRCATSYHVSCIPKAAVRLILGPTQTNRLVCERHEVLPSSIRWRPPLIIPLWVGVSTLKELSFSLSPEWLNGDVVDVDESVIIYPEGLPTRTAQLLKAPKERAEVENRKPNVVKTKTHDKAKVKSKPPTTVPNGKIVVVKPEVPASFYSSYEFVPEFSLEPPPGFVMEPYKSRSRNLYVVPRPMQTSREAAHICSCIPDMGCADEACVNRSLQIECDARFCPCGGKCQNQRLQKREWQPMRLIFTGDRGCGMMSQVPIKTGDLVIEYVGEVLDELTFRQRIQENTEKKRPQDNYYMMQLTRHLVIDARKTGNNARFLNHSCSPNCRTEIWEVAKGELRAGIFAMYDIPAGVELTYDYNFELFSKAVNSESVLCRCGASNCSKYLGARPLRLNSRK